MIGSMPFSIKLTIHPLSILNTPYDLTISQIKRKHYMKLTEGHVAESEPVTEDPPTDLEPSTVELLRPAGSDVSLSPIEHGQILATLVNRSHDKAKPRPEAKLQKWTKKLVDADWATRQMVPDVDSKGRWYTDSILTLFNFIQVHIDVVSKGDSTLVYRIANECMAAIRLYQQMYTDILNILLKHDRLTLFNGTRFDYVVAIINNFQRGMELLPLIADKVVPKLSDLDKPLFESTVIKIEEAFETCAALGCDVLTNHIFQHFKKPIADLPIGYKNDQEDSRDICITDTLEDFFVNDIDGRTYDHLNKLMVGQVKSMIMKAISAAGFESSDFKMMNGWFDERENPLEVQI